MRRQRWATPVLIRVYDDDQEVRYVRREGMERFICGDGIKELLKWDSMPAEIQLKISTEWEEGAVYIHLMIEEQYVGKDNSVRDIMRMVRPKEVWDDGDLVDNGIRTWDDYHSLTGNLETWLNNHKITTGFYWLSRIPSGYEEDQFEGLYKEERMEDQ